MAQREVTLLVLIDLSAAFDTVHHDLRLNCFHCSGVKDAALQWFEVLSLLSPADCQCKWTPLLPKDTCYSGVPQGSVWDGFSSVRTLPHLASLFGSMACHTCTCKQHPSLRKCPFWKGRRGYFSTGSVCGTCIAVDEWPSAENE